MRQLYLAVVLRPGANRSVTEWIQVRSTQYGVGQNQMMLATKIRQSRSCSPFLSPEA